MIGVFTGFVTIGLAILVGYLSSRLGVIGPEAENVLNRVSFYFAIPALLFTVLAKADIYVVFSSLVVVALISAVVVAGLFVAASVLWFHRPTAETTIGALASSYVNSNNIGLPIAIYVLGNASYVAPLLLLQLLVFAPLALTVLDTTSRGHASVASIISQPIRNPMIIASALGVVVALTGIRLPDVTIEPLLLLGGAAVPLVLMAFGMSLHGSRPFRADTSRKPVVVASILKSVLMPVVAFLCARYLFGLSGDLLRAAVVLAALPAAQNVYNFASRYERGQTMARDTVLLTTILSLPILMIIAVLLD